MMNEKQFYELDIETCEHIVKKLYSDSYDKAVKRLELTPEFPTYINDHDNTHQSAMKLLDRLHNHFCDYLCRYSKKMLFRLYEMVSHEQAMTIYELLCSYYMNKSNCQNFNVYTNDGMTEFLLYFYFYGDWREKMNAKR